jgi:hypothetical protein
MFCIGQTDRIRGLLADSGESQGIYRVNLWDANEQRVWIDLMLEKGISPISDARAGGSLGRSRNGVLTNARDSVQ